MSLPISPTSLFTSAFASASRLCLISSLPRGAQLAARLIAIMGFVTCTLQSLKADTVYVTSQSTNKLMSFDTAAPSTVATLSSSLFKPSAMAQGPDGNLYIAEWGDGDTVDPRISRYNPATHQLSVVATLDYATQFNPSSLAFRTSAQGSELLIGRLGSGPILKVSGWNGGSAAVSDYTSGLSLDGGLGLAVAADGTLYVSDTVYNYNSSLGYAVASGKIVNFDASGAYIGVVATDGSGQGGLSGPTGLLLSGQMLYSTSVMNGKLFATNLGTESTAQFATTGSPFEVGPIAQLSNGLLLAGSVSGQSNLIYQFSANGSMAGTFGHSDFGTVSGIVAVPEPQTILLSWFGIACMAGWLRGKRTARATHA